MTDYYTCSHGNYSLSCKQCEVEDAVREARHQKRKASRVTAWYAKTSWGRERLSATHEAEAVRVATERHGEQLQAVTKSTTETVWEKPS